MSRPMIPALPGQRVLMPICAALLLAATAAAETTVLLPSVGDNTLYESEGGTLSNGSGPSLFAGRTAQGSDALRRALMRFDVAGAIPPGATIVSAELRLQVTKEPPGAVSSPFWLFAVSRDWGEGASAAIFGDGAGTAAENGDATWRHTFYPGSTWTSDGGDFAGAPSGSVSISGLGLHSVGSTAQMVADVQGWLDAPAGNFGWILAGDESTPQSARRFDSREGSSPPLLVVSYDLTPVPDLPASGLLLLALALGAVGFATLIRRRPAA